uniref:Uncharacterized protein n=1 Tax=Arundo donax TaxID=35708 RepID=A0A0A9BRF1_ARUDO
MLMCVPSYKFHYY